jgi:hypothetical protein
LSACYDKYIAAAINQALNNAVFIKDEKLKKFIEVIVENKHLFKSLIKTPGVLYKIEGLLFCLFPKKCVTIYKLIKGK